MFLEEAGVPVASHFQSELEVCCYLRKGKALWTIFRLWTKVALNGTRQGDFQSLGVRSVGEWRCFFF